MILGQVFKRLGCQVFQASESPCYIAPESISALFSAAPPKSCLESVRSTLLHCFRRASTIDFLCRYYINTFYPGAALKIQAFFRRIRSGSLIAPAQLRKLRISQSVFALVIQRVLRGHLHRQFIVQFHASALTLQRAFRGHRSRCVTPPPHYCTWAAQLTLLCRYESLGKERSQMETWVNMWMQMVLAGIEGEVASRDVEAQLNHVLVKPEPANYFLGGSDEIIFDDSFSHLYNLVQKQSVRALHLKIVSMADACLAPSSSIAIARVEALASFMLVSVRFVAPCK